MIVEAEIAPEPFQRYDGTEVKTPSFVVTVAGARLKAEGTDLRLSSIDDVESRFLQEARAVIAALGVASGQRLQVSVESIQVRDAETGAWRSTVQGSFSAAAVIARGDSRERLLQWRAGQAAADPIYRDLLEFRAEADGLGNPRPAGYNMVERLESRFGGRTAARHALGLSQAALSPLVSDQSAYRGDRHADHPASSERPEIDAQSRRAAYDAMDAIISAYETQVLGGPPHNAPSETFARDGRAHHPSRP